MEIANDKIIIDDNNIEHTSCKGDCYVKDTSNQWIKTNESCDCKLLSCNLQQMCVGMLFPEKYLINGSCGDCDLLVNNEDINDHKPELIVKTPKQEQMEKYEKAFHDIVATFNPQQKDIFSKFNKGMSLFITGYAGTGKSHLLKAMILDRYMRGLNTSLGITAITGIAGNNISSGLSHVIKDLVCTTIHSWSGIGVVNKYKSPQAIVNEMKLRKGKILKKIQACKTLLIEEISMLPPYYFILLDKVLRIIKGMEDPKCDSLPFGGVQVILSGDFCQLSPIKNKNDLSGLPADYHPEFDFVCQTEEFKELLNTKESDNDGVCMLTEIYRQKDIYLQELLLKTRYVNYPHLPLPNDVVKFLQERIITIDDMRKKGLLLIAPKLDDIKVENTYHFANIGDTECKSYNFEHQFRGKLDLKVSIELLNSAKQLDDWENNYCVDLKVGASVMLTNNISIDEGLVNGLIGVVQGFELCDDEQNLFHGHQFPIVKFESFTKTIQRTCKFYEWEANPIKCYPSEDNWKGLVLWYMPLKIAAALTTHKSQGNQFNHCAIDLGTKNFSYGHGYCALSRIKERDQFYVTALSEVAFKTHPVIIEFYRKYDPFLNQLLTSDNGKKYLFNLMKEDEQMKEREKLILEKYMRKEEQIIPQQLFKFQLKKKEETKKEKRNQNDSDDETPKKPKFLNDC